MLAELKNGKYGWNWLRRHFAAYAWPYTTIRRILRARKTRMGTRKELERYFVDIICWGGEEAVVVGRFSRSEINQMYLEFGKRMGLTELMPKQFELTKRDIRKLKGSILNRIGPEARQAFKEKQRARKSKISMKAIKRRFHAQMTKIKAA